MGLMAPVFVLTVAVETLLLSEAVSAGNYPPALIIVSHTYSINHTLPGNYASLARLLNTPSDSCS